MSKAQYISLIVLLFLILVLVEYIKPERINWSQTYNAEDDIPYGTLALNESYKYIFPGARLIEQNYDTYEFFQTSPIADSTGYNYIMIQGSLQIDSLEMELLLDWIEKGNNVFLASRDIYNSVFIDSLDIKIATSWNINFSKNSSEIFEILNSDTNNMKTVFTNPNVQQNDNPYPLYLSRLVYSVLKSKKGDKEILGKFINNDINFLRMKFGNGYLYYSSIPEAFINFNMIREDCNNYAFKSLSYLPKDYNVIIDGYYSRKPKARTPLRYLLSQPSLKFAVYITFVSILLYIFWSSRRRQRAIPIITPPKNSTLEFIDTISNLYLEKGSHKLMAEKRIEYFFEFIRNRYNLQVSSENFPTEIISKRSGVDKIVLIRIINEINDIKLLEKVSKEELKKLNNLIEEFYTKVNYEQYLY